MEVVPVPCHIREILLLIDRYINNSVVFLPIN
jgi:hypothetical protein